MTALNARDEYQHWMAQSHLPTPMLDELRKMDGNQSEIEDAFGTSLDFGTGGLRGIMGAGLNRMNIYTVRRATAALAMHIQEKGPDAASAGVAIGYDCRHNSPLFAEVAACTLAAYGIRAYIAPLLCPTPELSWSVRKLGAVAGIMITASHNPPKYNGYKVYNRFGGQLLEADANDIKEKANAFSDIFAIPSLTLKEAQTKKLVQTIPAKVRVEYLEQVVQDVADARLASARSRLKIVYTPLHGTGHVPIQDALRMAGYADVVLVPEQTEPDGDFSTVKSPNPEEAGALKMACDLAVRANAQLVMGTDPDADRVGIAVRDADGNMLLLTGNQVGALLVNYLCGRLPHKTSSIPPIVFKTIVTSDFGAEIARAHGVHVEETLTGFKYIGDRITAYEQSGEYRLLVGYEESYGYLISPIVRDKDAVQTCLAIAEMSAHYLDKGQSLLDVLEDLYQKYGYYGESLLGIELHGHDGPQRMKRVLANLREQPLEVPGLELMFVEDYLAGERRHLQDGRTEALTLPKSDVQKFYFKGGHWAAVRPSGTEPKMKIYVGVRADDANSRKEWLDKIQAAFQKRASE